VSGSGTIRVLKRNRSVEQFDARKLAAAMWRAMQNTRAPFEYALRLAQAVELYLQRRGGGCVSSSALFEMTVKALRHVGLNSAADGAESYCKWRNTLRKQLRIRYNTGNLMFWDKGWLCELARRSWHVCPATARILAGQVEIGLFRGADLVVSREAVVDALNRLTSEYGLADAVPVEH
jgi:hypothetical protein